MTDETFIAALFEPFARASGVLVAVSGGPDSMALLWLASRWAAAPGRPRMEAATVDHALRAGSLDEARQVGQAAAALGIAHHILTWTGPKPTASIQERARTARYGLLDACAAQIGADVVLTAHHADDQAETILFRLLRGSGLAGLAGMAQQSRRGDIINGRPLLGMTKDKLIGFCDGAGIAYVSDPSNIDPRFARTRLRRLIPALAAEGLGRAELLRLGARAARMDAAVNAYLATCLSDLRPVIADSSFRIALATMRDAPVELLLRILMKEAQRINPMLRKPRFDRAEALAERLAIGLRDGHSVKATLGGTLVELDAGCVLTIRREGVRSASLKPEFVHNNRDLSDSGLET